MNKSLPRRLVIREEAHSPQRAAARRQGVRVVGDAQVLERSANETSCAVTPRATLARQ
jgi:hypothetical protein